MTHTDKYLSTGQILSYSLPSFSNSMIMMTVAIFLPNFYTDDLGVTAGMLSWVFLFARIWDAITDPLMGHISDRTRTRWGRRRPYFLFCPLPIWLFFYLIWSPGSSLSATGLFLHLMITYLLLYTFWTVFNIPYHSLAMELTPDYHERSRLFGVRQGFLLGGTALGTLAPAFFAGISGSKLTGYSHMALIIGGLNAVLIVIMFFSVRERTESGKARVYSFIKGLGITFRNRAFVVLLLVYLTSMIGASFLSPLTLYIGKYVIKAEWASKYIVLAYMLGSFLSIPLWLRLSRKMGKNKTWTAAMVFGAIGFALSYTYHEGTWLRWIIIAFQVGVAGGCTMILGPAIQADVIDSDELETGARREGAFVGVWSFMDKAAVGLAIFIGLQGLEIIGYTPNIEQTPGVIFGMKVLYCLLPAVLYLVAAIIFQKFPITQEVHAEIRAKLDKRKNSSLSTEVM